jgi:hypothetical protein
MNLECFVEDLFLGGQWSIILGYRRLSVKSLLVYPQNNMNDTRYYDLDRELFGSYLTNHTLSTAWYLLLEHISWKSSSK